MFALFADQLFFGLHVAVLLFECSFLILLLLIHDAESMKSNFDHWQNLDTKLEALCVAVVQNRMGSFLGDHDRRSAGLTSSDSWHDGGIDHTHTINAVDLQICG